MAANEVHKEIHTDLNLVEVLSQRFLDISKINNSMTVNSDQWPVDTEGSREVVWVGTYLLILGTLPLVELDQMVEEAEAKVDMASNPWEDHNEWGLHEEA